MHNLTERYPSTFAPAVQNTVTDSLKLPNLRDGLFEQLDSKLTEFAGRHKRWMLTGSGDSLFAALAMRPALARWTGLDVEVRTALELARYELPLLTAGSDLVVAVSNSGSSSRTREAVALSRDCGISTLGISGSSSGPLVTMADHLLVRRVAPLAGLPENWARVFLNMSEYLATLVALSELGLAIAVARNRLDLRAADATRAEMEAVIDRLGSDAEALEPTVAEFAATMVAGRTVWALGSGPSKGTAAYVAAKFHEQVPIAGIRQDLEEWAHLEYFLTLDIGRESIALLHAPPGAALDRAREIASGISGAGGRALVVTGAREGDFDGAEATLRLSSTNELLSPLSYHLPGQFLALHLARLRGVPHIPLRRTDDYWLIRGGELRSSTEGLI